jgi:Icc-related predicted phosphoesterase
MTKFQIMSDIHQEFSKVPLIRKENIVGEVLLLAGDITNGPARIEYLKELELPIYAIMGNHEYYRTSFNTALGHYRDYYEYAKITNLELLENDTIFHNNMRIIGTTLWTNFQAPTVVGLVDDEIIRWEDQTRNCEIGMADFSVIRDFSVYRALEEHKKALQYIKEMLSRKHDGPTIVMTHHAPSFKSSHPKYDSSYIKAGFCSDLDYVIEEFQPDLWIHGHTHESFDYNIGKTRIICNPYGYGLENRHGFKEKLIVEL